MPLRSLAGRLLHTLLPAALALLIASPASAAPKPARSAPPIGHVFLIVLENKDYQRTFGADSPAPYLAQTLTAQGALLESYYGIGHNSLGNYIAMISGQGPNVVTQADCPVFMNFIGDDPDPEHHGQARGRGCVYPASVPSLPDQLEAAGRSWKGYFEDMGADPRRESATCGHPPLGSIDNTQSATARDSYATRHNPFVYFHSIIDDPARCAAHVVNLDLLDTDLQQLDTTAEFNLIVPNLCHDGHDSPCANGEPGDLASIDAWLQVWVPKILRSPAFARDGVLIVGFDESDGADSDSSTCCGAYVSLNSIRPGITGPGGGLIGAVMLSRFIQPGTRTTQPYNHYSLLRSLEDWFGLLYLGYTTTTGQNSFGSDVFTAPAIVH